MVVAINAHRRGIGYWQPCIDAGPRSTACRDTVDVVTVASHKQHIGAADDHSGHKGVGHCAQCSP